MLKRANDTNTALGKAIYVLMTLFLTASFLAVFQLNYNPETFSGTLYTEWNHHYTDMDQYARLGDALIHGELTLDLPVPDEFLALENPYDVPKRMEIGSESVPIFWDHAYYQGNYYCYFGVVPAIAFFVPYQLVTGSWLSTPLAIRIIGVLALCAMSLLTWRFGRRYFFETATVLSLCICQFALFVGCNFAYLAFVARFYSVPIMSSLLFTALGLWFWMGAAPAKGVRSDGARHGEGSLSCAHLAMGSFCMALNLGCRPQFIIASFFAFVVFKTELFETRVLFSRKGLKNTIAALAPFVVVIVPLLMYNYARFGSLLDFGSNYNLTGFNMLDYDQSKRLTLLLMVTYLFQPWSLMGDFPFVHTTVTEHLSLGWAPNEPFFGGYFLLMPILLLVFMFPFVAGELKRRNLFGYVLLSAAITIIVLFVDTRTAGITQRYFSDFGFYVATSMCLVLLSFQAKGFGSKPKRTIAYTFVALAILVTVVLGVLTLLSPERYDSVFACNPDLYYSISALFTSS